MSKLGDMIIRIFIDSKGAKVDSKELTAELDKTTSAGNKTT